MPPEHPDVQAEIEGLRELRKALRQAEDDFSDLKDTNLKAAEIAARASSALAPIGSGPTRGALKATIRAAGTKTAGIIRAGKKAVAYAGPIHWGWPNRRRARVFNPRIRGGPIPAQPFLADGAKNSEGQWLPVYIKTVDGIVRRISGA